jgi:dTDP-4-amino-4,6-dideoxygalactose transaminase
LTQNFLPDQYIRDSTYSLKHNYLVEQFSDRKEILNKISKIVEAGDFTLGSEVNVLEEEFANLVGAQYAIGVGSGTDALFLSLKALGIGPGDEVITTTFTFYATVGAIVTAGATPIFCDINEDFNINPAEIRKKITNKTKAIIPVHWAGRICSMNEIQEIANEFSIPIVEDACHAILAEVQGVKAGNFGILGCFSFHPLKNLNVWGDGGIIVTNSSELNSSLRLLRNHGLKDRDHCEIFAYNSRLDTIQAVVARHMLPKLDHITNSRIKNAGYLDSHLLGISEIFIPKRMNTNSKEVFHLYSILAEDRDGLVGYLNKLGIDAKIHYRTPMHMQEASRKFGYAKGMFPTAERVANMTMSLPVHEFMTDSDLQLMVNSIRDFYDKNGK